jgi:hypothetical protein
MKTLSSILNLKFLCIILVSLQFVSINVNSQQPTVNGTEKKAETKFPLFFEKVYIHTDRTFYAGGDDIWFKAYLVNAISNIPMETSSNLYVDLISSDLQIQEQKLIRLNSGFGFGDFKLPDSVPGGTYKIRAYTNWMRNFGNIFLFEKEIKILGTKNIVKSNNIKREPTIQFFPESGSLINESLNNIAFKAVDENGKSCEAEGFLISSTNDTISLFKTAYAGMGVFSYMPLKGQKITAEGIIDKRKHFKVDMTEGHENGYGIQYNDYDTTSFFISIITNQQTLDQAKTPVVILNGMSHSKNCFTVQLNLSQIKTDIRVPKKNFYNGIACFTLYDTLLHPQSQRLVYISKNNNLNISLTSDKQEYLPREKTNLTIKVTDRYGFPIQANISLAVTDTELAPDNTNNIISYLNLESEIKGKIENPANYFDPSNKIRFRQLDLLLLTQGWRDFIWKRIKDTTISVKHMVEPGIALEGRVRQKFANNPIPNAGVTLFAPKAIKTKLFWTKTHADGKYYFDGLEFYGNQNITITTSNEKGKNKGWIFLDKAPDVKYPVMPFYVPIDSLITKTSYANNALKKRNILKKYTLSDTIQLNEVVVTGKNPIEEKQEREFYINGGPIDYNYKIQPEDESMDIGTYLAMKIPRLQISSEATDEGPVPYNRVMVRKNGALEPPAFILNGFPMRKGDLLDENVIYNLSVSDIDRIIVSTNDINSGGMGSYAIGIFTKPNAGTKTNFYSVNQSYPGYYEARTFYSPIYPEPNPSIKPDLRTTLYWNPEVKTNENGECTISYFNNDKKSKIRVTIEGLTNNGTPIVSTNNYIIK